MSETIKLGGRAVSVHALTMKEIREVLVALREKSKEPHVIDMVFDDDVPAVAISAASGLSLSELEGEFTQQEIRDLLDKVRALNPFFVGMMERLCRAGMTPSAPSPVPYVA